MYPERLDQAKERAVRHQPATPAPGPYAGDPVALAFATAENAGHMGHSLQGDMPLFNKDGTFSCFICKQKGHKARDCLHKDAVAAGTFKPDATATANTTTGGTTAAPAPVPAPPCAGPGYRWHPCRPTAGRPSIPHAVRGPACAGSGFRCLRVHQHHAGCPQ